MKLRCSQFFSGGTCPRTPLEWLRTFGAHTRAFGAQKRIVGTQIILLKHYSFLRKIITNLGLKILISDRIITVHHRTGALILHWPSSLSVHATCIYVPLDFEENYWTKLSEIHNLKLSQVLFVMGTD